MKEAQRKKAIYIGLALAVIYGVANIPSGSDKSKDIAIEQPKPARQKLATKPVNTIDIEFHSTLPWGADPFYRAYSFTNTEISNDKPDPIPMWTLNGIVINEYKTAAVINKNIVRKGDTINGARVICILKDEVILEQDGSEFSIFINKGES